MSLTAQTSLARPFTLDDASFKLLTSLNRYQLATAQQLCRILYWPGSLRYVQNKLRLLAAARYIDTLVVPPTGGNGRGRYVYVLARRGRALLTRQGIDVRPRHRPSEQRQFGLLFFTHSLAITDVMVAADQLCNRAEPLATERALHERFLPRVSFKAFPGHGGEQAPVRFDAWIDFTCDGPQRIVHHPVGFEVDRGTEQQAAWRRKVAAIVEFYKSGVYAKHFGTKFLTVAVVAVPGNRRRDQLVGWTAAALQDAKLPEFGKLFLFTGLPADTTEPSEFFLSPSWLQPLSGTSVPLVELEVKAA